MADAAARARALVGARFRLHGREAASGLDCVGVAVIALSAEDAPTGYALRGGDAGRAAAMLDARWRRVAVPAPGDVLLFDMGAGQLHLGVLTGTGVVHADAALRRVVERPGPPGWPVIGAWRGEGDDGDAGVDGGGDGAGRADRRRGGGAARP